MVTIAQVSGALREPILNEVKAGWRRISQTVAINSASRVSVLVYAGSTERLIKPGSATEVDGALAKMGVEAAGAEVHLLDALRTAIDLLKAQPEGRRKLIVLVSDGTDINPDKRGFIDLGNRAQEASIVIDTIGYNELDPAKPGTLQEVSKRSYGIAQVAKSATEMSDQLSAVVEEIQKQYVAIFRLSSTGEDEEHTLQVAEKSGNKPVHSNAVNVKLPVHGVKQAPGNGKPPQPVTRPLMLTPPT